ncbi:acetyl-CoA C-acetyltransferase [Zhongshania antarctica]|uniref:Acetyl-CoA C-acetyltransferase n=1 Tax=Zhongshania antarctica TaxID=641702 RepID=A0A840R8C4_9GAMM|nr:thiolase family protein [Zhongshania antarctica]MBB5189127.1 acetyl-CoA C-acetyltransferase [Zhongshania antarctica]
MTFIYSAKRTALGGLNGQFVKASAPELGATAIKAACEGFDVAERIDEVLMGNVISAGIGQAPARQAALKAGLSEATPCVTVSKVCGSGMQSIMSGMDQIKAGSSKLVIAGGMENMSLAPYLMDRARQGYRLGHGQLRDAMFVDGLEDAYSGKLMGLVAEQAAAEHHFTRDELDDYALMSLERALAAQKSGAFINEIAAHDGHSDDEQPGNARPEKIRQLRPAFSKEGVITAANASSISDGAAALLIGSGLDAEPLAKILAYSRHAGAPEQFPIAPVYAVEKLMKGLGWGAGDVDLFEINEAFAMVALLPHKLLGIPLEKINVNGGACSLGHPLGCSGARIVVTLIHALRNRGLKRGIASLCIGGGEATAVAIELV